MDHKLNQNKNNFNQVAQKKLNRSYMSKQNRRFDTNSTNPTKQSDDTKLKILQLNINGIQNKFAELTQLTHESSPDIITIQKSKFSSTSHKLNIGGDLITYIKEEIPFTEFDTTQITNITNQYEIQITSINLLATKKFHKTNLYIPPRNCNTNTTNEDQEL